MRRTKSDLSTGARAPPDRSKLSVGFCRTCAVAGPEESSNIRLWQVCFLIICENIVMCLTFVPCLLPISHCSFADKRWVEDDRGSKHGRTVCKSNDTMVSFVIPFPSSCVEQNIWALLCNDVLQVKWFMRNGPWKYLNDGQFFGNPTNWQMPSCQRSRSPFTIIRWIRGRGCWWFLTDMNN